MDLIWPPAEVAIFWIGDFSTEKTDDFCHCEADFRSADKAYSGTDLATTEVAIGPVGRSFEPFIFHLASLLQYEFHDTNLWTMTNSCDNIYSGRLSYHKMFSYFFQSMDWVVPGQTVDWHALDVTWQSGPRWGAWRLWLQIIGRIFCRPSSSQLSNWKPMKTKSDQVLFFTGYLATGYFWINIFPGSDTNRILLQATNVIIPTMYTVSWLRDVYFWSTGNSWVLGWLIC